MLENFMLDPDLPDTNWETVMTFACTRSNTNSSEVKVSQNVYGIDDFKLVIVQQWALAG